MGFMIFILLCTVLTLAAYVVVRAFLRSRKTFAELLLEVRPLSLSASELIWKSTQGPIPPTWLAVADLIRIRHNSTIFTMLSDRFRRMIRHCRNERDAAEMENTYLASLRAHACLTKSLLFAVASLCFGKIANERRGMHMACVAVYYANEVMSVEEMTEVIDERFLPVLEGQFLHGS